MILLDTFRKLALALPEATEQPHFEKTSFRINKKIFATYDAKNNRACLKMPEIEQSVFCSIDKKIICPVPNKWGQQGWTFFDLGKVKKEIINDALRIAYCEVAPKKLAEKVSK
jgi:predicted DNA-binding protein (MmcQ/YjbR family)